MQELRNRKKKGLAPEEEGEGEIGEDGKYRIKGGYEQVRSRIANFDFGFQISRVFGF